ncbi:MAG: prolyl oligopeptidase family serine peptidase [Pirellulales bacterium]|nr:prolyl oligopeptidase family serine peptidase [Pirellulales bacterium]
MFILLASTLEAARPDTRRGDQMLGRYFRRETARLRDRCLADIKLAKDWKVKRPVFRKQLLEMLGLDPLPERTELKATVTGRVERDHIVVEKLHFQSRPGLYVTGCLFLPEKIDKPAPTILYLCGHANVKKHGISYGNKAHYQHHGCWFARHGYVCLIIDSLQLGEIKGVHKGTNSLGRWWWNNRGYTPAGVEAWNAVRALDYLESRKEVDANRIGVTGRSGGGIYSWWLLAIDDRPKAAAPVAGITDLQDHIVNARLRGHCDCNRMINIYRWDYPLLAAMAAPRPVLLCNTDRDHHFSLDAVCRLHAKVARIYKLLGAPEQLGLVITPGPHKDTQSLRVPVFAWFNQYLKNDLSLIDEPALPRFEPEELRAFAELPKDEKNTRIDETFVPVAPKPPMPESAEQWAVMRDGWLCDLRKKCFAGWPEESLPLDVREVASAKRHGLQLRVYEYTSQPTVRLPLYCIGRANLTKPKSVAIRVLDQVGWLDFLAALREGFEAEFAGETPAVKDPKAFAELRNAAAKSDQLIVFIVPRGIGPTLWNQRKNEVSRIRRCFMLLGQTVDGMRVWDVRRAIQAVRDLPVLHNTPLELSGRGVTAGVALFALLFEPDVSRLALEDLPTTFHDGPIFLNVDRVLKMPQAVALAGGRSRVTLLGAEERDWKYPLAVTRQLDWPIKGLGVFVAPSTD